MIFLGLQAIRPDIIFYLHCGTVHRVDVISVEESIGQLYVSIKLFTFCTANGKLGTNESKHFWLN